MNILEVTQLEKVYGTGINQVHALKGVTFTVSQGEFIAIVGTSGSGKSTLMNLIGGLDTPTTGSIRIRKHDIASLTRKELTIFRRRNIGFVFQNYSLMPVLNIYDNVTLPVTFDKGRHIDHTFIQELLTELGLWEKRRKYPSELSGGQQQRAYRKSGLPYYGGSHGASAHERQKIPPDHPHGHPQRTDCTILRQNHHH